MDNTYNFQRFSGIGSKIGNYYISYAKSGFILLSGFYQKEKIFNYSKAILYFDPEKTAVAIEFTSDNNTKDAFSLIHTNDKTSGAIYARSFVKTHNIDKPVFYGRRKPKKIKYQNKDLFVIDLSSKDERSNTNVSNIQDAAV